MIYLLYHGLILRTAGAAVLSFLIVIFLGPKMIRFLVRKKVGDRPEFDHANLNQLMRNKSDTPTMGGILIVIAIFASVLVFANLGSYYIRMALMAMVWLSLLGGVDDWFKLRKAAGATSRDGLVMWQKILFQIGLAVLLAVYMNSYGSNINTTKEFYLPFKAEPIALGMLAYVVISVLTMVGSSNAVNLTDGMDGLAAGCMAIACTFFLLISLIVGAREWSDFVSLPYVAGSREMSVLCAAMLGSCLGFLWYNAHPAQVFMGDTGSLTLGGLLGFVAVVTRAEVLLLITGGVFVMEAGSVLLQVSYFKATKPGKGMQGKRLFRCAPLHHHFHLGGWAESKVVIRFWIMSIIFAALALATLKLR